MQVLRTTVKLRPRVHRFSENGWWSGWVLSRDGRILETSESCKFWQGKETSEFMHWAVCAGGSNCFKSKYEER